ncbi:MAG: protein-L-isoaspartate(D-aspartate) O-methyltransferase [Gammaproteobacteria bacterium]|nr:protein-L-isoaspartate(D-aspartate) O-methyltransferase [Gammaproteobacteria bacterium]
MIVRRARMLGLIGMVLVAVSAVAEEAPMRETLLDEIALDYRATAGWTGLREMSPAVREALSRVRREAFVRDDDVSHAYVNRPLSIGHGQTISQPFIVALMTDLLAVGPGSRVLEIGTGSGYQAAVLAELGAHVWTIEIVDALAKLARERLARLGYTQIAVRAGDGNLGWPDEAPFDGIIVTAAGPVPPALLEQLAPGGRLVIPVGSTGGDQQLTVITRQADGTFEREEKLPVRFVPLTGDTAR